MRALVTWAVLVVVVAGTVCHVVGDASTATTTSGAASQAASSKSHQRMHSTGAPVAGNTRTPAEYDPMVHENIEPIDFLPLGGPLRRQVCHRRCSVAAGPDSRVGAVQCQMHLELAWETEVESAAYSAPLMSPIQSTDMKQVVVVASACMQHGLFPHRVHGCRSLLQHTTKALSYCLMTDTTSQV